MNAARRQPSVRRLDYHYFVMQSGFWIMYAAICGYQTALLLGRGLSNSQVGLVIAVRCLAGIVCQPLLGGFADRHPEIPLKYIVSSSLCVSLVASVALIFIPMGVRGILVVFFVMGGFELSTYPFVDSMAIQYMNAGVPIRYSLSRGFGSLAYAVMAVLLGLVVGRWGVETTLPIHVGIMVVEIGIIFLYPTFPTAPRQADEDRPKPQSVLSLLRTNPRFFLMLTALFFGITGIIPLSNFMVNMIINRGGTAADLGPALFFMAAVELPTAFVFPRLLRRWDSARLLLVSLCFMTLKALLLLCTGSLTAVILIQATQMLGYGLFTPSAVYFVNESVPEADRVRGQTLMMVATNGLGGVVGNLLAGWVLDFGGIGVMLICCTLCSSVGVVLGWLAARMERTS